MAKTQIVDKEMEQFQNDLLQSVRQMKAGMFIILPDQEEDAAIAAAAPSDPDAQPLTDKQLKGMRPMGRPRLVRPKATLRMLIDVDVLEAFKATGPGWQTRINAVLRGTVASGKL